MAAVLATVAGSQLICGADWAFVTVARTPAAMQLRSDGRPSCMLAEWAGRERERRWSDCVDDGRHHNRGRQLADLQLWLDVRLRREPAGLGGRER